MTAKQTKFVLQFPILFCVSFVFSQFAMLQAFENEKHPNIILVLVDDLGAHDLSGEGSLLYETPHIDQLARRGVRFTSGYAACAVCSPTRAALQSGKSPARLGITDWIRSRFQGGEEPVPAGGHWPYVQEVRDGLYTPQNPIKMELAEVTIAERLKEIGYQTCFIGKWHLGTDDFFPDKQGYDENIGGCDLGQPPSYFDPYYPGSTEKSAGDHAERPLYRITTMKPRQTGEFLTDREAAEAVDFMRRNQETGKPFYLQVSHYAVHTPIMGKSAVVGQYKEKKREMQADENLSAAFDGDLHEPDATEQGISHQRNAAYAALVESVDDAMGTILAGVEELGLANSTIIIFTSDNGGFCGVTDNFPLRNGKGTPYEGGIRVPWIIYVPETVDAGAAKAAKICDTPISTCDVLPTLLDFAGVPLMDDELKSQNLEGVSVRPLLTEASPAWRRDMLFWHFPHYRNGQDPYSVIRQDNWKLIRFYARDGGRRLELFDLKHDPRELQNVANSPENAGRVQKMSILLDDWLTDSGARLPKKENPL